MFERPDGGELAIIVHVEFAVSVCQEELEEFRELVLSAGAIPTFLITAIRKVPDSKFFVGSGKAEEIKNAVAFHHANIVIINHSLTPAQQRNLERFTNCRVVDRIGLILDIFAQRARTFEGKLQVELAQLQHLSTRLVHGWTHLERQKGGIGLRGPGETQLESDRRLINDKIKTLKKRLDKVEKQRELSRRARKRAQLPTISLVGYTNAGKSTLFNMLTGAHSFVADQLFATLDPTLRKIKIKNLGELIIADTVGFIRHLPHELVNAFHATLEESKSADLLLHVIDAHEPRRDMQIEQVIQVLTEIGADKIPRIDIYNKIDLVPKAEPLIHRGQTNQIKKVYLSAKTGQGLSLLQKALSEILGEVMLIEQIHLTVYQSALRIQLYQQGYVLNEMIDEQGNCHILVKMPAAVFHMLVKDESIPQ